MLIVITGVFQITPIVIAKVVMAINYQLFKSLN